MSGRLRPRSYARGRPEQRQVRINADYDLGRRAGFVRGIHGSVERKWK